MDNWNQGREDVYCLDTRELLHHCRVEMREYFEDEFGPSLAFVADYSPASLQYLERRLAFFSKKLKDNPPPHVVMVLGYYFGETLVRNVPGAHWHEERIHTIQNLAIRNKHGNITQDFKPVQRILNLFLDPQRFPLSTVYETMMAMVTGEVDVENAPEGQRNFYDKNGDYLFRIRHSFSIPSEV